MNETEKLALIFKALSDPSRIRIFQLLHERSLGKNVPDECGNGPLCVNGLANRLGITQSAVSQHLRILKQVGLVQGQRRGSFVHYSVDPKGAAIYKATVLEVLGSDSDAS
jgi:ArsR family transcriptional regulator